MPWKETCAMEERLEFALAALQGEQSFTKLCRYYGVSRKTGYKWFSRYQGLGERGLIDGRKTRIQPINYCDDIYDTVIELRKMKPSWGPKKLTAFLATTFKEEKWPSPSTIKIWLRKEGLSYPPKRPRGSRFGRPERHLRPIDKPNDVWCADFKGWFRTGDKAICEPLTILDGASRYLLACQMTPGKKFVDIRETFEQVFAENGYPTAIRTDNGAPFGSQGYGRLSPLSVWLIKKGIWPEKIRPGHPEENGRQERFHRTLKAETAQPPAETLRGQQQRFESFKIEYNHQRPHEALGQQTPASYYVPGKKSLNPEYEYPSSMRIIRVGGKGYIKWNGEQLYLTQSLAKEHVGVKKEDEGRYRVEFLGYPVLIIDESKVKR